MLFLFQSLLLLLSMASAKEEPLQVYGGSAVAQWEYEKYFSGLVSLQYSTVFNSGSRKHFCTGFVVHPRFVLTAAHCNSQNDTIVVVAGAANVNTGPRNVLRVLKMHRHPGYSFVKTENGSVDKITKDALLLELAEPLDSRVVTKTMGINFPASSVNGKTSLFIGWGMKCEGPTRFIDDPQCGNRDGSLKKGDSTVYERGFLNIKCPNVWVSPGFMCVEGYKYDTGACAGDSGGPLLMRDPTYGWVAVGITSYADCDGGWAGYQATSDIGTWTNDVISASEALLTSQNTTQLTSQDTMQKPLPEDTTMYLQE